MIKDTITLSEKIQFRYIDKLWKNNVFTTNENGDLVLTKRFHKTFNTMEDFDLTGMIEKITNSNQFLTKMVRLGGCLIAFNVPRNELFHSLNIVSNTIDFPNIRNQDCNRILAWLDHCFPPNLLEKALANYN